MVKPISNVDILLTIFRYPSHTHTYVHPHPHSHTYAYQTMHTYTLTPTMGDVHPHPYLHQHPHPYTPSPAIYIQCKEIAFKGLIKTCTLKKWGWSKCVRQSRVVSIRPLTTPTLCIVGVAGHGASLRWSHAPHDAHHVGPSGDVCEQLAETSVQCGVVQGHWIWKGHGVHCWYGRSA